MGFNTTTLLSLPFGLIIPVLVILFFIFSKHRSKIAYDSVAYGFISFLASILAVFIIFIIMNALFISSLTFDDDISGLGIAGTIFAVMIAILFFVCETLKITAVNKFRASETRSLNSAVGFAAGVIVAQNGIVFVALNIFDEYEMTPQYALFSGAIICLTGVMYLLLSIAGEQAIKEESKVGAYGIASVYYLFWIGAIIFSGSRILMYISSVFFFVLSLVISGVFVFKNKRIVGEKS